MIFGKVQCTEARCGCNAFSEMMLFSAMLSLKGAKKADFFPSFLSLLEFVTTMTGSFPDSVFASCSSVALYVRWT